MTEPVKVYVPIRANETYISFDSNGEEIGAGEYETFSTFSGVEVVFAKIPVTELQKYDVMHWQMQTKSLGHIHISGGWKELTNFFARARHLIPELGGAEI